MLLQIALGSGLLVLNVILMALAALVLESAFRTVHPWLIAPPQRPKLVLMLVAVGLWVLGVITVGVWIWALSLHLVGAFATFEEAVYFSLVCFTTLGFGDVLLPAEWRILSGMTAANGFLNFGLLTALLIEALRQIRLGQVERRRSR